MQIKYYYGSREVHHLCSQRRTRPLDRNEITYNSNKELIEINVARIIIIGDAIQCFKALHLKLLHSKANALHHLHIFMELHQV